MILVRAQSGDARLAVLHRRMTEFYAGNRAYYDDAEGDKSLIYGALLDLLRERAARSRGPVRVLELGAGRTSFPDFLRRNDPGFAVEFLAHDINDTNAGFYAANAIDHVIGGWPQIAARGPFDVCLSTYVFEHLTEPHLFLRGMAQNLAPGGCFVIVCPKYVTPGYVPPAIRWLPRWRGHLFTFFLALSNLWTRFDKRPRFWICVEPAAFRLAWRRDNDAVHMVSYADVRAAVEPEFTVRPFRLRQQGLKARALNAFMLMSIVGERTGH